MGHKLAATVFVTDPDTYETVELEAGSEPEPRLAALVTNPAAWEDGKLPTAAKKAAASSSEDGGDKPAAKKAATSPARGGRRSAADEGSSS